jgi:hypothetical protein
MMVTIASLLFVICTFDLAIGLLHNFRAFVQSDNAEKEFLNLGDWINITRVSISRSNLFLSSEFLKCGTTDLHTSFSYVYRRLCLGKVLLVQNSLSGTEQHENS